MDVIYFAKHTHSNSSQSILAKCWDFYVPLDWIRNVVGQGCIIELFWIQYSSGSNRKINKRLTAQRKWTLFLAIKVQGGLWLSDSKEMYNNGWGGIKQTMLQCYILHCSTVATIRAEAWTAETSFKTVSTARNTNLSFITPRKNWEKQV